MVGDRRRSAPANTGPNEDSSPPKKRRPTSFGGVAPSERGRHLIESSDDDCEKAEAVKIVEVGVGKNKRTPPTSTFGQSSASRKGAFTFTELRNKLVNGDIYSGKFDLPILVFLWIY